MRLKELRADEACRLATKRTVRPGADTIFKMLNENRSSGTWRWSADEERTKPQVRRLSSIPTHSWLE
jgi:hypothetical protein